MQLNGKLESRLRHKKSIDIDPGSAEAFNNIGNALQEQGNVERAIEAFKQAIAIRPNYAEAFWNHLVPKISLRLKVLKCLAVQPNF